ncbi:MAG: hypothetical protein M0P49_00615 [Bacilli bacterium]|nr:hypothetical protein [Bacilli bacterium]
MRQLIEFLGMGQCFGCGGTITIVEKEETEIELEPNGMPVEFVTTEYSLYGECRSCGELFEMEKIGLEYRPINRLKKLIPTLDTMQFVWLNPFGYKKNERR